MCLCSLGKFYTGLGNVRKFGEEFCCLYITIKKTRARGILTSRTNKKEEGWKELMSMWKLEYIHCDFYISRAYRTNLRLLTMKDRLYIRKAKVRYRKKKLTAFFLLWYSHPLTVHTICRYILSRAFTYIYTPSSNLCYSLWHTLTRIFANKKEKKLFIFRSFSHLNPKLNDAI